MFARLRNYSSVREAKAEWSRLSLPQVAENEKDLYNLVFFFIESSDPREVERMTFVTEELGGDAYLCSTSTPRAMLVFEHGVLQAPGCRMAPDDRLLPLWSALSNYLLPVPSPWRLAERRLRLDRSLVMGVLNVTPDSFFDGGKYLDKEEAVRYALQMVEEGADVIDVGGESTRPYAEAVPNRVEMKRVVPIIRELSARIQVPISVDTRHPRVAEAALKAGAEIVNDVSGLRDQAMAEVVAEHEAGLVLMHMLGEPQNMQDHPVYEDVVGDICLYLGERLRYAEGQGVDRRAVVLDPGVGFGKTSEHNLEIVLRLREFRCLGRPLLIGASRKSFIGKVLGQEAKDRKEGSLAIATMAMMNGANILRAHDVKETKMVGRMVDAVHGARWPSTGTR